nr:hypothetical protein [Tanacetum cinerariifolium]
MFKVFNCCLTRTYGHDQTMINILQLFHIVVNRTNVDYAALLWWDFMNCISQKKDYIQYPCFTKLIIADLIKKYTDISSRFEEDYHSIKDDIPLVSVFTTRNNGLKRLNERELQIQKCKVQEVKASNASSRDKDCSRIVSDKGNDKGLENQSNTSGDETSRLRNDCNDKSTSGDDTDIRPSYDTKPIIENDQNAIDCDDERVALANLIVNLKLDVDENKKIQMQLKKANTTFAQELKECKSSLAKTTRTLGESNNIRDSCLVALQSKQTEFEKYKAFNDHTFDYDKLKHKLNETLGLLAQKEIDIKEGLKVKAYEISVVKKKHDELVKQSLLTKSHYEGLVKEKTKIIMDLKLKEEKDIDKMISMEQQIKFLNGIVYKRNQSIQTIHMLAPKGPTFNGRPTFANPMYLKKAQSEIPCLYAISNDQYDPANRLVPIGRRL